MPKSLNVSRVNWDKFQSNVQLIMSDEINPGLHRFCFTWL